MNYKESAFKIIFRGEKENKKLLISFSLMLTLVLSTVGVFAATTRVSDIAYLKKETSNQGVAILYGNRDNSTDRLSNVKTSKLQKGTTTVGFGTVQRPSQFSAKVTAKFYTSGTLKQSNNLSI